MSAPQKPEPLSWTWKPRQTFEVDIELTGQRLKATLDPSDRPAVAEGLARLADAVMGGSRHLVWRWEDGAEWDLDGNRICEAPEEAQSDAH